MRAMVGWYSTPPEKPLAQYQGGGSVRHPAPPPHRLATSTRSRACRLPRVLYLRHSAMVMQIRSRRTSDPVTFMLRQRTRRSAADCSALAPGSVVGCAVTDCCAVAGGVGAASANAATIKSMRMANIPSLQLLSRQHIGVTGNCKQPAEPVIALPPPFAPHPCL